MKKELNYLQESFKKYLTDVKLDSEMDITGEGLITFHWSNWNMTCRMIKEGPLCLYTKEAIVNELDKRLEELRANKIWVNNKLDTIESSEYDLYKFYMDPRVRQSWFGQQQSTLYSDESQKGPFSLLTSLKWKSRETFSYFVYKKILLESHQLRQFRLNAQLPFTIKFDEFELNNGVGAVKQFNSHGMLVHYSGRALLKKFEGVDKVKIKFEREHMNKILAFNEVEDFPFDDEFEFHIPTNVMTNHFKLGEFEGSDFFVFVPYQAIEESVVGKYFSNGLKDVVFQVFSQFDEAMAEELSTFHSWVKKVA